MLSGLLNGIVAAGEAPAEAAGGTGGGNEKSDPEECGLAGRNNGKIRQYRKPLNINLGIIIFSVIFHLYCYLRFPLLYG